MKMVTLGRPNHDPAFCQSQSDPTFTSCHSMLVFISRYDADNDRLIRNRFSFFCRYQVDRHSVEFTRTGLVATSFMFLYYFPFC